MARGTRTAQSSKNGPVSAAARLNAMMDEIYEFDGPIWDLIHRLLDDHKGDKDVEAVCFLLAGAMGTVRRLRGDGP